MSIKKKTSTTKDILFISISSFLVVAAWVGFNLYHSWVTTTITPELQIQIVPIEPNFDMTTIEKLKLRRQIAPITSLSQKAPVQPTEPVSIPTPTQPPIDIPVTIQGG